MSTTKALDGLRPSRIRGGSPNSSGMNEYRLASGYAANIFTGDLVRINAGSLEVFSWVVIMLPMANQNGLLIGLQELQ